jgi:hypothetical protein
MYEGSTQVPHIETRRLADYNHLFQKTLTAALLDYETLGWQFDGQVLSIMFLAVAGRSQHGSPH